MCRIIHADIIWLIMAVLGLIEEVSGQAHFFDRSNWQSNLTHPRQLPDLMPCNYNMLSDTRLIIDSMINFDNNRDFYLFQNILEGDIIISVTSTFSITVAVYNATGALLLTSSALSSRNSFLAKAGTNYILMARGSDIGIYTVELVSSAWEDFGNDFTEAQNIDMLLDGTETVINGNLNWKGDMDAFLLYSEEPGTIVIRISSGIQMVALLNGTDTALGLSNGFLGAWSSNGTHGDFAFQCNYVAAGEYYRLLIGSVNNSFVGPYTLTIAFKISLRNLGTLLPGTSDYPGPPIRWDATLGLGEIHYYEVLNAMATSNFTIRSYGNTDVKLIMLDQSLQQTGDDNSAPDGLNFVFQIAAYDGTTVSFQVQGSTGTEVGNYAIEVTTDAQEDFGNTFDMASIVTLTPTTTSLNGELQWISDEDMFKFDAPVTGFLTIRTYGTGDTFGILYDSRGWELVVADDANDLNFLISYHVSRNLTYYLKVHSFGYGSQFSYNLTFAYSVPAIPVTTRTSSRRSTTLRTTSTTLARGLSRTISSSLSNGLTIRSLTIKTDPVATSDGGNGEPVNVETMPMTLDFLLIAAGVPVLFFSLAALIIFFVYKYRVYAISNTIAIKSTESGSSRLMLTTGPATTSSHYLDALPTFTDRGDTTITLTSVGTTHELSIPAFLELEWGIDFIQEDFLSRGGGGKLYFSKALSGHLAESSQGQRLVVKNIADDLKKLPDNYQVGFWQELSIMWKFRDHKNFARIFGFSLAPLCVLMKYYELGDMLKWIRGTGGSTKFPYTKARVLRILKEYAEALNYMQAEGIIHGDIKPQNVLLDTNQASHDLMPIITDFGISQIFSDSSMLVMAFERANLRGLSIRYAAPEVLFKFRQRIPERSARVIMAADVFSFAGVLFCMVSRQEPWK